VIGLSKYILNIGATGNVGSKVVNSLKRRGESLKITYRNLEKLKNFGWKGIETTYFDYNKPETFKNAFEEVSKVFIVAPSGDPNSFEIMRPFLEYIKKVKLEHIVFLSALGADDNDQNPLRLIETEIISSKIPYTILRANFFMQNFLEGFLEESIENRNGIFLPAGNGKTSFIDCRDIAEVAAVCLTEKGHANKEYVLTGGEALDHFNIAKILTKYLGREITYYPLSDDEYREILRAVNFPEAAIDFMISLYTPVKLGMAANITKDVHSLLKRKPTTFKKYVKDYTKSIALVAH
jgi:uncharacterized protein YbjT (DUF2867 family)